MEGDVQALLPSSMDTLVRHFLANLPDYVSGDGAPTFLPFMDSASLRRAL